MLHRRLTGASILVSLLALGFAPRAWADYGVTTPRPLSDARKAKIDNHPTGTWRAVIQDKTYYLHVGTGNIVGKFNWMELVLVNPGEKRPSFYMHHFIGFPTKIDGESYFNVALTSKLIAQLRGSRIEQLESSVERYEVLKYRVSGKFLDIWAADQDFIRAAIKAGKIKGREGRVDDTRENLIQFIRSSAPKLFVRKFRYTRLKEPAPPKKAPTAAKPAKPKAAPAKPAEPGKPVTKS